MSWISGQPVHSTPQNGNKRKNACPADINDCPIHRKYEALKKAYRRLKKFSIRDELTGYYNYSFLMTTLSNEMERTRRSGLPCCIILTDIDHFKTVNDEWGHESGNLALKAVTGLWRKISDRWIIPVGMVERNFCLFSPMKSCSMPFTLRNG